MTQISERVLEEGIEWNRTNDVEYPYQTNVDGILWKIRANPDYPETDAYTLIIGNRELDFSNWPNSWDR